MVQVSPEKLASTGDVDAPAGNRLGCVSRRERLAGAEGLIDVRFRGGPAAGGPARRLLFRRRAFGAGGVTIPPQQADIARFLTDLAGSAPKETHISAVFIGTDTVWKLKKAVRLPFLDFSTVEARHHFLMRELELNRPHAPGIYRDVAAVVRQTGGGLALGDGAAVDWVLRMAPVPEGDFLDVIAGHHGLTPALLDALGDCVARYHDQLPPVPDWDSAAALLRVTGGNGQSALAAGLPAAVIEAWQRCMNAAIEAGRTWLDARAAAGFVRRCHGDLHLGNLCLWEGTPVAFDALEFDEAMATIDVGYDLGFLLMDLDRRVGRKAANRVMNRYVARTGDAEATGGLPMFLSQRAMVRAHVLAAMGQRETAEAYLKAAGDYLVPRQAGLLAIGGLQGTGKSTLARGLAPGFGPAPGALVLRSDELRKRLHGVAPEARLPQDAYSGAANAAVNFTLIDLARSAAAGGHAVIVDATFLDLAMRRDVEAAAREAAVPFTGIWLQAPLAVLEQRVGSRQGDASDATVEVLRRSVASDPGAGDWVAVNAVDGESALKAIRRAVAATPPR
jgi:aminoglycoside phosphotransferase family enzyme/predicted kinase